MPALVHGLATTHLLSKGLWSSHLACTLLSTFGGYGYTVRPCLLPPHTNNRPSPYAQATDAASFKFVVKVPMGAFPGEVIGVIKVNGKPYGSVTVPPGSKPGKRLKMQVPHPPGSKVSFDYSAAYVPPGEGSRVSPAAPVAMRCAGENRWTGSAC